MNKKNPTRISKALSKSWWSGDSRVEEFMIPVSDAIKRHIEWPSEKFTDIYNKAYEAVYNAIKSYETKEKEKESK